MILKDLHGKILRFIRGRLNAAKDAAKDAASDHIPASCLHDYPASGKKLAILYSGDGGWARLTTSLSHALNNAGIPVAGIDCMHYFWKEKTPAQADQELTTLIRERSKTYASTELILIGYSMGADVLPAIAKQLPQEILASTSHILLLSPSHRALLKFRFIGWLGFATPAHLGHPLLPDLKALVPISITCIAGEKEHDSLTHENLTGIAQTILLPGGHHYGSDYATLSAKILSVINTQTNQSNATSRNRPIHRRP